MAHPIDTQNEALWKQRYRVPSIFFAGVAQLNPQRGLAWTNLSGSLQFHTWNVPSGKLEQLTHTPGGQNSFLHLSPDGEWAYFLKDEHGNEIGHYVRIPYGGGEPEDITPSMPSYSSFSFSFNHQGTRLGFTTAGPEGFTVYRVDIAKNGRLGQPFQLYHMKSIGFGPMFSSDGKIAVVASSEHTGKNEFCLIALNADTGDRISEVWDGENTSIDFNQFSPVPGDNRLLATTNRSGMERIFIWNPLTNERSDFNLEIPGAQTAADWSADGRRVLVDSLDQAVQSLHIYQLDSGQLVKLYTPEGLYRPFFTPDGERLFATWNDASHNNRLVELDPSNGTIIGTRLSAGDAPSGKPMVSISFPSSDGQVIQGWLCLPDGQGPFPTILDTHGGPTGVQTNGYNAGAQAWVDHGFAFLSINYRGSITFGREFEQKIWHDLGHWEIEDMAAAHQWLVGQGISQPDAVFLTGWSYGGYLTLLGLGKCPDLWAGGMAGIAIADWTILWEDSADTLRGYQEALFGGTPLEIPERYRISSPITYAGQIRAPILIIQGRNDSRTPARPIEMFEHKMRELGKQITVHWFETGHMGSFADTELGIKNQEMMMRFAYDILAQKRPA